MTDITCIWIHQIIYNTIPNTINRFLIKYKYTIHQGQSYCYEKDGPIPWNEISINKDLINRIKQITAFSTSFYEKNPHLKKLINPNLSNNPDLSSQIAAKNLLKYATDECILVWWEPMTEECDSYKDACLIEKKEFSKLFNYDTIQYTKNLVENNIVNKDVILDIIKSKGDRRLLSICYIYVSMSILYAYTISGWQTFISNFGNNPSLGETPIDINTYRDFIKTDLVKARLEKEYGNPISTSKYSTLNWKAKSNVDKYYSLNASNTKYSISINKFDYRNLLEKGAQNEMKEVGFSYISKLSIRNNKFVDLKILKLLNIIDINQIISPTCSCAYIQSIQYPGINLPNLPICYGSYIISWGVTNNETKQLDSSSNLKLLYKISSNTDYCKSLKNLLRIEGEHVAHFTQMSIYTGVPSSNTKEYLKEIGIPMNVSDEIYKYIVECAQYTMDISVSIFNQYKFHHDLIIFKSSPTGIEVKFEEELLEKYIKQIYYKDIKGATSNDFPSYRNCINASCNIPDMLKSNPSSDIFIFNGNWWNNPSGVPFVNVKGYNNTQLKDLYEINIRLIKKQLHNRCNSLQEKLNNFEISYATGSIKGCDKLVTILSKISLHIFDKIKKDLELGDNADELKEFSDFYPKLHKNINNKFYKDILLKINPSTSLPHSGGGLESKDVKYTMGRMTDNLRSNKQFKQQEARREKLDFERYDPMDGALQLYNIIKPYEELFKLQYFNFDEVIQEPKKDNNPQTSQPSKTISKKTQQSMKTPQSKNFLQSMKTLQSKYPKKRALALLSNFNTIQPKESIRTTSSYGGSSKKKKKSRIKKKTKKKHKKKYNGRRTVRTKRTGQNHKKNEKTKKKNNKKKVNKKKKK